MTKSPENQQPSSPGPEKLLQFELPEVKDVEINVVRLEDGRIVARTAEELEEDHE